MRYDSELIQCIATYYIGNSMNVSACIRFKHCSLCTVHTVQSEECQMMASMAHGSECVCVRVIVLNRGTV